MTKQSVKLLVTDELSEAEKKVYTKMERWMTTAIKTTDDAQPLKEKLSACMDNINTCQAYGYRDPSDVLFSLYCAADFFKGDACILARDSLRYAARIACRPLRDS